MKKFISFVAAMLVAAVANASLTISMDSSSNPYRATVVTGLSEIGNVKGIDAYNTFDTFCVEAGEGFVSGATYDATVDNVIIAGNTTTGQYVLEERTKRIYVAWLYDNANLTTLFDSASWGYYHGSAEAIQRTIWQTQGYPKGINDSFLASLDSYLDTTFFADYANYVKVLNLSIDNDNYQSQLVMIVPSPAAILLAGMGTSLVGFIRRRSL